MLEFFKKKRKNFVLELIDMNNYPKIGITLDTNFFIHDAIKNNILKSKYYEKVSDIY